MALEKYNLNEMFKGWFIGNFEPSLFKTNDVEIGVKKYQEGEFENLHFHKIATEFTVIISGVVEMNGVQYTENDIIKIIPGVSTNFKALTDVITVVVKLPGANNDKYEQD
ncbi:hypothetical protein ACNQGP_11315 [Flavobacterium sp. GT2N3]|uniref:hypothetical protein n=1 Tax=unclassified Flavobacterium TaxID=196869 RepID=UPI003AAEC416